MKRKITLLATGVCLWLFNGHAQTPCANDLNGFVASKNVGLTGFVQLKNGFEEKAAQTYTYSGTGKITSVRVHGNNPTIGFLSGVPLILLYHDAYHQFVQDLNFYKHVKLLILNLHGQIFL